MGRYCCVQLELSPPGHVWETVEHTTQSYPNPQHYVSCTSSLPSTWVRAKKPLRPRVPGVYNKRGERQRNVDRARTTLYYFHFVEEELKAYSDAAKNQPQAFFFFFLLSRALLFTALLYLLRL